MLFETDVIRKIDVSTWRKCPENSYAWVGRSKYESNDCIRLQVGYGDHATACFNVAWIEDEANVDWLAQIIMEIMRKAYENGVADEASKIRDTLASLKRWM